MYVYLSHFSLCLSSDGHFSSLSCLFDTDSLFAATSETRRGLCRAEGPGKDLSDGPTTKTCTQAELRMIYRAYF